MEGQKLNNVYKGDTLLCKNAKTPTWTFSKGLKSDSLYFSHPIWPFPLPLHTSLGIIITSYFFLWSLFAVRFLSQPRCNQARARSSVSLYSFTTLPTTTYGDHPDAMHAIRYWRRKVNETQASLEGGWWQHPVTGTVKGGTCRVQASPRGSGDTLWRNPAWSTTSPCKGAASPTSEWHPSRRHGDSHEQQPALCWDLEWLQRGRVGFPVNIMELWWCWNKAQTFYTVTLWCFKIWMPVIFQ